MTTPGYIKHVEHLTVEVFATRQQMGQAAAAAAAQHLRQLLSQQNNVRIVFAAAPSQNAFLAHLSRAGDRLASGCGFPYGRIYWVT